MSIELKKMNFYNTLTEYQIRLVIPAEAGIQHKIVSLTCRVEALGGDGRRFLLLATDYWLFTTNLRLFRAFCGGIDFLCGLLPNQKANILR
jgi:hypothetical protein